MTTAKDQFQIAQDAYRKHTGNAHDPKPSPYDPPLMKELSRITLANSYADSWARDELDLKTKSFICMAITATLGTEDQFKSHVRAAMHSGVTKDQLVAMLMHFMGYLGAPRTATARRLLREVWKEQEAEIAGHPAIAGETRQAFEFRVRGRVQGVGFRPMVWRIARELGLAGEILNDGQGVLLRVEGEPGRIDALLDGISRGLPPLARIDRIERGPCGGDLPVPFRIAESLGGEARTEIAPDAATCPACIAELSEPSHRRYRYAFTTCTQCGPRLSIATGIPFDRETTTMRAFAMCDACGAEYRDPADRHFHAETISCPACGPTAILVGLAGAAPDPDPHSDDIERAARLIRHGAIVAIKGIGGYHLCCDATDPHAVARLRQRKRRDAKPFALMARDIGIVRRYCALDAEEERQLAGIAAPIVLLRAKEPHILPESIAPGLGTLGFMLPASPLQFLILQGMDGPLVMTSGNLSSDPPVSRDGEVQERLSPIADHALMHDRAIANRSDDSVVRIMDGKSRMLRRARGFAPSPIDLPPGFEAAPDLQAMGGEMKSTFCLVKNGQAFLSPHQGDLENPATLDDYCSTLALYRRIFDHRPAALVIDMHPEYLSSKLARVEAAELGLPLIEVQHHHAHVAACLAENRYPLDGGMVLGIVLDGLGFGDDGTIWGGEFLLADYRGHRRLARLKPVAMPGGGRAILEPWRNLYAHLIAAIGWDAFAARSAGLAIGSDLAGKPRALLDAMIANGLNAPLASSCGRLFDAVAAALGLCSLRQAYEGEAAMRLESLAETASRADGPAGAYPFARLRPSPDGPLELDPAPMWNALLDDLARAVPAALIALRFHEGLARALSDIAGELASCSSGKPRLDTVALSGGCFQNRLLFESVSRHLADAGFTILSHAEIPANDGGLSLGQAAIGAARLIAGRNV